MLKGKSAPGQPVHDCSQLPRLRNTSPKMPEKGKRRFLDLPCAISRHATPLEDPICHPPFCGSVAVKPVVTAGRPSRTFHRADRRWKRLPSRITLGIAWKSEYGSLEMPQQGRVLTYFRGQAKSVESSARATRLCAGMRGRRLSGHSQRQPFPVAMQLSYAGSCVSGSRLEPRLDDPQ